MDNTGKGTIISQCIAAISASIGAFIVGLSLGWSSPVHLRLTEYHEYKFKVTDSDFKWIGSLLALGAATQCIPMGYIVNKYGPKQTILFTCFPCIIGWYSCLFAMNLNMLYIGRFIIGMTSATFCVAIPIYIGDIAHKDIRGKLCSLFQLNITIGILFTYIIGWKLKVKYITVICGMFPIIFGIIFFFMPESPEFLISQARFSQAIDSLKWLRGENFNCNGEIESIRKEGIAAKQDFLGIFYGLFRKECMKAITIGVLLMVFQQLSGINAIIFYTQKMFEDANISIDIALATVIVGGIQVIATSISLITTEKCGRRIGYFSSIFVMGITTTILGIYFFIQEKNPNFVKSFNLLPIICVCVYIIAFSLGVGPIPWVLIGELFASDVKGLAAAIVATVNWFLAFTVSLMYDPIKNVIGISITFWLFSFIAFIGSLYTMVYLIETKGKSLIEIQRMLKHQ